MLSTLLPNAQLMLAGIFATLTVATAVTWSLARRLSRATVAELRLRIRSWWVMVSLFTLAVVINPLISLLFFAMISALALREFIALASIRGRLVLAAFLAVPIQYYWIGTGENQLALVGIPLFGALALSAAISLRGDGRGFTHTVSALVLGLILSVLSLSHLGLLVMLPAAVNPTAGSAGLLLYLVFLTEANDVSQYVFGRCLGRRKLVPRLSPNKTVAGFVGGLAATLGLATLLAPWLTPLDRLEGAARGLLIGLLGVAGDLVVSAIKRDAGVKDAGNLLPGHGGVLDRVDSLIFTAPVFFHLINRLQG